MIDALIELSNNYVEEHLLLMVLLVLVVNTVSNL